MSISPPSLTYSDFASHARSATYNLIPLYQTLHADLETPVSAYLKVTNNQQHSFLLESVEGGERQGRYSYIGTEPYRILEQNGVDPLYAIEEEMRKYRPMPVKANELPHFTGGGVGYISYDCIQYWEPKVGISQRNSLELPDSLFMFCRSLIIFDHVKHTVKLVAHIYLDPTLQLADDNTLQQLYNGAVQRLQTLIDRLQGPLPPQAQHATREQQHADASAVDMERYAPYNKSIYKHEVVAPQSNSTPMYSSMGQQGYEAAVKTLQHHIQRGDIIQAVPAHRCARPLHPGITAFDVYRSLRVVNPSPYMFFLDLDGFYIVGASPEQLVKVEVNGRVTTHPIAGTRKRGATEEEDLALEQDLLSDTKERAEHIMLVDLGRNDVGRIAEPGTVTVESLMHIERYSHVMHIVSVVSGQLAEGKTPYDAFRSIFPAGTLSGAPKIRAMQLIGGLEGDHRNVYGGAVGYVSFSGVLDVAIAIRTFVVKDNVAYLQAGGGIVYDSEPTPEWKETLKKMGGVVAAIDLAETTIKQHNKQQQQLSNGQHYAKQSQTDLNADVAAALDSLAQAAKLNNVSPEQLRAALQQRFIMQ